MVQVNILSLWLWVLVLRDILIHKEEAEGSSMIPGVPGRVLHILINIEYTVQLLLSYRCGENSTMHNGQSIASRCWTSQCRSVHQKPAMSRLPGQATIEMGNTCHRTQPEPCWNISRQPSRTDHAMCHVVTRLILRLMQQGKHPA